MAPPSSVGPSKSGIALGGAALLYATLIISPDTSGSWQVNNTVRGSNEHLERISPLSRVGCFECCNWNTP
jgi:hypothetical protein